MKYLFELTILILFALSEFNTTGSAKKRKNYMDLTDEYDSLDEKINDIFSVKPKKYHHINPTPSEEFELNSENVFDINFPFGKINSEKDIQEEGISLPNDKNEKKKLLNDFNKNLNLDLKPKLDLKPENSIFEQNKDSSKGPIGKLIFSESPLNPRFQQKKEMTYRSPTYVSFNFKTIKPKEPLDDEVFDNDDSDDPMLLEGKKDTSQKIKVKVNLIT